MGACEVGAAERPRSQCYLDYNATVPVKPPVIEAMTEALGLVGNPSSVHGPGRAARQALERAREAVAALVGASPRRLVFTSGGTEANNQALASVVGECLASAIEHDSVLAARPDARRLSVTEQGVVDLAELAAELARTQPALISVMAANNETGVIQPLREVVALARRSPIGSSKATPAWTSGPSTCAVSGPTMPMAVPCGNGPSKPTASTIKFTGRVTK